MSVAVTHPLQRLAHLPREARDTLFLLAVIGWLVAPHAQHLPGWCVGLAVVVLVWRGWLAWHNRPLPGAVWRLGLLALAVGATWFSHKTLLGRDAGVTLIVVLLALKTLELRARRDAFVVFFLGFFLMLTHFFFSQSLPTAAAMLLGLLGLLTALVNAHRPVGRPPLVQSARAAAGMALLGAPIMALLFALFPRLAPLWGTPSDALTGRTGLSNTMQVGAVARLAQDESVAMRVKFEGAPPPQSALYFRGPVLSVFDGRQWRPFYSAPDTETRVDTRGTALRYEVTLEPHQRRWLLTLDATPRAPQMPAGRQARLVQADLQWTADAPVTDLLRYGGQAWPDFSYGPADPRWATRAALSVYVTLPPDFNPRTLALAAQWKQDPRHAGADARHWIEAALHMLRTGDYEYTLEPGVSGQHSADEFWFDAKAGFCEHIASAFVVLMRALGLPARIVTGFQGGQLNSLDGYWTVRNSDAHAWAEVWIDGAGWTRVDPTAALSPWRIGAFERLVLAPGALGSAIGVVVPATLTRQLRQMWEAVNNAWNQRILNYTQTRQMDLLKTLGFGAPSWQDLLRLLAAVLTAAVLVGLAWAWWERRQHDPWLRLVLCARQRLLAAGLPLPAQATPRQMAQALAAAASATPSAAAASLCQWLLALEGWRYAPSGSNAPALRLLRQQMRSLPWPARAARK